jgi:integrase
MGGIRVKLRNKKISGGRLSLFLDYYPPIINLKTGKPSRREFLTLTVWENPKTELEKLHNKNILREAELMRMKRENELAKPEIYMELEKERFEMSQKGDNDFLAYYLKLTNQRQTSNYDNWNSAYKFLYEFTNGSLKFSQVNEKFLIDFREHLLTTNNRKEKGKKLSQNSASSYFNKIKACLKEAQKEGIIQINLNARVKPIKYKDTIRQFLTLEEVNLLVVTPFEDDVLKRASLFSALTGLRFSDVRNLKWGDIQNIKGVGYQIGFRQQKTKSIEYLPISDQAYEFMGEKKGLEELVFKGLKYSAHKNLELKQWVRIAGINKDITFHCFRHTFATLQLSLGTDIYTISKMLGHRDIKTTAIYAKIMDENKRAAANRIVLNIPKN